MRPCPDMCLLLRLGGIRSPTRPFPGWQVLVFFWPVTLTQLYMFVFWIPLVLLDYDNYLRSIGERGTGATALVKGGGKASKAPKGGVKHGCECPPNILQTCILFLV